MFRRYAFFVAVSNLVWEALQIPLYMIWSERIAYTVYSEWLNVEVRKSWTYSDAMPVVPPLGTGLSPLLQWLVLPPLGLRWARRIRGPRAMDDGRALPALTA